ncbi:MAG: 2-oxoacid:acceptor oxidoreductase subunit alpha [Planctomycetota bacterium]
MSTATKHGKTVATHEVESVVVRFAGDSGDGMQLAGTQLTNASAYCGNDLSTLPDFPAEIRAPQGSLFGVSGFQIHFSRERVHTPGDQVDALVVMNPAALKMNLRDLEPGGVLVVNRDAFTKINLTKAGYTTNPLEDGSLKGHQVFEVPIDTLTAEANKVLGLGAKAVARCRNFCALGLVYWLYNRPTEPTRRWIEAKFASTPALVEANINALKAGYHFGDTAEMFPSNFRVAKAKIEPGHYRSITGNEATALGLITAAQRAGKLLFYGSYPITPASDILHTLAHYKNYNVVTFQAEDEIAAITSVIGASFAGAFAATGTSGPGLALKSEGLGLAIITELPLVVIDVQRGGPSTGLPTKTEQADLLQAIYGRHSESPLPVLAAATPADCFHMVLEAFRIAVTYMTPVILLTDGYLANGAEPWRIPDVETLPTFDVKHPARPTSGDKFLPYMRDARLARPWALPGTPGLEHRIGGLEKQDITGDVSYDPDNHQRMVNLRAEKVARVAESLPPTQVLGDAQGGDLLLVGWGSTYGAITSAVERCRRKGMSVSSAHLRYLNPLPDDLGDILRRFDQVLVPEMNTGQLRRRLRDEYLIDAQGLNKVQGKPFMIREIEAKITELLS